jgi:TP901 family phage tail tape measure protein
VKELTAAYVLDAAGVGRGVKSAEGQLNKLDKDARDFGESFDRNTDRAGGALSRLGQTMGSFGIPFSESISKMGDDLESAKSHAGGYGQVLSDVGKVATGALAGGLIAAGAESIHLAENYQQATASMAASAGISTKAAASIGTAFVGTAGKSTFSAQEIMSAFGPVAGQLRTVEGHALDNKEALTVMTAAMDLAEGSGSALGSTTQALAQVMQAYGLGVHQAANASDVLFNAARMTGNSIGAVAQVATQLKMRLGEAAPSLADIGGLMVDMASHGIAGSRGIRTVSTSLTGLISPSTTAQKALAAMGVNLTDANGKFIGMGPALDALKAGFSKLPPVLNQGSAALEKQNITNELARLALEKQTPAVKAQVSALKAQSLTLTEQGQAYSQATAEQALFGRNAQMLLPIINGGAATYNHYAAAVAKTGAAHAAAEKQAKTFHGTMEKLKATGEDLGISLGNFLLPKVEALGAGLAGGINWLEKHKAAAIALGAVIAGPVALAIGAFAVNTIGKLAGSIADAGKTVAGLGQKLIGLGSDTKRSTKDVLDSNGTSAQSNLSLTESNRLLTGSIQQLASASRTMAEQMQLAFGEAGAAAETSAATITASITGVETATEGMAITAETEAPAAGTAFGEMLGPIGLLVTVAMLVATHWKQIWGAVKDIAKDVGRFLSGVWHGIETDVRNIWGDIEGFFKNWWPEILDVMTGGVLLIPALLVKYWHQISADIAKVWGDIEGFFKRWWPEILGVMTLGVGLIPGLLVQHWRQVENDATRLWHDVTGIFAQMWDDIIHGMGLFLGEITKGFEGVVNGAFSMVEGLLQAASHIPFIGHQFKSVENDLKGFQSSMDNTLSGVAADMENWGTDAGKNLATGMAAGITNNEVNALEAAGKLSGDAIKSAREAAQVSSPSRLTMQIGSDIAKGFELGILAGRPGAHAAARSLVDIGALTPAATAVAAGGSSVPVAGGGGGGGNTYIATIIVNGQVIDSTRFVTTIGPAMRQWLIANSQVNGTSSLTL